MSEDEYLFMCRLSPDEAVAIQEFLHRSDDTGSKPRAVTLFQRAAARTESGRRQRASQAAVMREATAGLCGDPEVGIAACRAAEAAGVPLREWIATALRAAGRRS